MKPYSKIYENIVLSDCYWLGWQSATLGRAMRCHFQKPDMIAAFDAGYMQCKEHHKGVEL